MLNKNDKMPQIVKTPSKKQQQQQRRQQQQIDDNDDNNNDIKITTNCCYQFGAKVPARLVLYFLSWSGFLVSFMMRNDINFALVAMTHNATITTTATTTDIPTTTIITTETTTTINDSLFMQTQEIPITTTTLLPIDLNVPEYQDIYNWSSGVKSVIISSFYWSYVLSQIVGGIATQHYGTKHVFGWSQLATAICSLCIPWAADLHYSLLIALRSIQGFASGLTWPAMYAIVGLWIPLNERSRFMSSFQGFSIGIGLTYPLCGFLIDYLGWRYVFYTTGSLGLSWCLMWYLYAFNTPAEHPRISNNELNYIENLVTQEHQHANGVGAAKMGELKVPWTKIFTSLPAWAIAITTFGRIWIHYVFIVNGPVFMQHILKFDYKSNGLLSGLPFILSYVSSVIFCYITDKVVAHNYLSLTHVRKLMTALSQIIPGLLVYCIGYTQNITLLLILWNIAVILITASYAGAMANIVDIAPNFAAPVLAFCQTIHMSASFLSPLVTGLILTNENSIEQWRSVFGLSTIITLSTYMVYQFYGTAEIQSWNYAQMEKLTSTDDHDNEDEHDDDNDNDNDVVADNNVNGESQVFKVKINNEKKKKKKQQHHNDVNNLNNKHDFCLTNNINKNNNYN